MQKILKNYVSITGNHCLKCNVRFLCNPCYVHFAEDGNFRLDKEFCKSQKKNILNKLKEYVLLNEMISNDQDKSALMKRKRFHQFIMIEKGPVNAAVIDLLKGDIYQVKNEVLEKFNNCQYEDIDEFVKLAAREELIIEVDKNSWIPAIINDKENDNFLKKLSGNPTVQLEIEEGVPLDVVNDRFSSVKISQVLYYGPKNDEHKITGVAVNYLKKGFNECLAFSRVDGNFGKIQEARYITSMNYNSCWGGKIAVTGDGKIRPCIYSKIIIGDIYHDDITSIIEKAKKYWHITRDKVDKCKDCELKHVCFDCREIAARVKNDLYAPNPFCKYDPYKGTWEQ
jgi:radical SAM protein with 4Fe4S-binding SPASM domain